MTNNIKGKLALITGASAGIGRASAEKFASCGVNLVLTARRSEVIESYASELAAKHGIKVAVRKLDVRDRNEVETLAKELKDNNLIPDILLNNAGLSAGKDPVYSADIDDWEVMIDTNIKGFLYVLRAITPLMMENNRGHIINIGSIAGVQVYPGGNVYNATKFAVRALSQGANIDLVNTKIRVSEIRPGAVNTEFSTVRFKGDKKAADSTYDGYTELTAYDIADAILYVANTPEHVNIQNMLVTPTAQRSVNFVNRDNIV